MDENPPQSIKWVKNMPLSFVQMIHCADRLTVVASTAAILKNVLALSEKNPVKSLIFCVSLAESGINDKYKPVKKWMTDLLAKYMNTPQLSIHYERARQLFHTGDVSFLNKNLKCAGPWQNIPKGRRPVTSRLVIYLPDDKNDIAKLYDVVLKTKITDKVKKNVGVDTVALNLFIWCLMLFSDALGQQVLDCRSVMLTTIVASTAEIATLFRVKVDANFRPENCYDQVWYHLAAIVSILTKVKHMYGGGLQQNGDIFFKFFKNTSSLLLLPLIKERVIRIENLPAFIRRYKKKYLDVYTIMVQYFMEFSDFNGTLEERFMATCIEALSWTGFQLHRIIIHFAKEHPNCKVWTLKEVYKQMGTFKEQWDMLQLEHGQLFPFGMILKLHGFEMLSIANYPDLAFAAASMSQGTIYKSRKLRKMLIKIGMKVKPNIILKCLPCNVETTSGS